MKAAYTITFSANFASKAAVPAAVQTFHDDENWAFQYSHRNSDVGDKPCMQEYILAVEERARMMLLDALIQLKQQDSRACRSAAAAVKGITTPAALII